MKNENASEAVRFNTYTHVPPCGIHRGAQLLQI